MNIDTKSFNALASCAIRIFAEWRTSKHPGADSASLRALVRRDAVEAIRCLWKNSDAHGRAELAWKMSCWMRPGGTVQNNYWRIFARERQRIESAERKAA